MLIAALALALAPPTAAADIAGTWMTQNRKILVRIGACGDHLCGRVAKILKPLPYRKSHDVANPDPALRGRSIVGIDILRNLRRDGDEWHGEIYDPVHGKTYRSIVSLGGDDMLEVKGCVAIICKTQNWPRAD